MLVSYCDSRFLILHGHIAGEDERILHPLLHIWVAGSVVQNQTPHQPIVEGEEGEGGEGGGGEGDPESLEH